MLTPSEFQALIADRGTLVTDGGLATELERRGASLETPLWSAELLAADPGLIRDVHLEYLRAGADCLVSASYQATVRGLVAQGHPPGRARELIGDSVRIARDACDRFIEGAKLGGAARRPIVAASVGPFGAALANGDEYRGRYGVSVASLLEFHAERMDLLIEAGPDLLACETIPSVDEARALAQLLAARPAAPAWVSFTCADGERLRDGTPIGECAALFEALPNVVAVGVNCTAPRHIGPLIDRVRAAAPGKAVVVYPNRGESYNAAAGAWAGDAEPVDFGAAALRWRDRGASVVGGCCRTTPADIMAMHRALDADRAGPG